MFILYCLFNCSYLFLKTVTPAVYPFVRRVLVFIVLLLLHFVVGQIVGVRIIRLWTEGGKKEKAQDLEKNPSHL